MSGAGERWEYLSGSFSSNTFRFVWSRMLRIVMKQPKSSFFARNAAMMARKHSTAVNAVKMRAQCEEVAQVQKNARAFASHERRLNAEEERDDETRRTAYKSFLQLQTITRPEPRNITILRAH